MQNELNILSIENPNKQFKNTTLQQIEEVKKLYKSGQLCEVRLVNYQHNQYALKVVFKDRMRSEGYSYKYQYSCVFNQIAILYHLKSENIAKLYWHWEDQTAIYLLMEYGGIRLSTLLAKNELEQQQIKNISKQIFLGVQAIHLQNFVHRDLCLQNITIKRETQKIKIIDFGFSQQTFGGRKTKIGTSQYMAPQVYYENAYNSKADIWSLGILLYQLFHKKNPFRRNEESSQQQFVKNRDNLIYTIDEKVPLEAAQLIKKMLVISPEKRLSIAQILKNKWLTGEEEQEDVLQYFNKRSSEDRKTQIIKNQVKNQAKQIMSQNEQSLADISVIDMSCSVKDLQKRLKQLSKIHSKQLYKKRKLTLELIKLNKASLQKLQ